MRSADSTELLLLDSKPCCYMFVTTFSDLSTLASLVRSVMSVPGYSGTHEADSQQEDNGLDEVPGLACFFFNLLQKNAHIYVQTSVAIPNNVCMHMYGLLICCACVFLQGKACYVHSSVFAAHALSARKPRHSDAFKHFEWFINRATIHLFPLH